MSNDGGQNKLFVMIVAGVLVLAAALLFMRSDRGEAGSQPTAGGSSSRTVVHFGAAGPPFDPLVQ